MKRKFLVFLPVAFLAAVGILFLSGRDYQFQTDCGCGLPSPQDTGEFDYRTDQAIFEGQTMIQDVNRLLALNGLPETILPVVLGETSEERWIEIDLSDQRLYAHEGERIVYDFAISSGKAWTPTPTGEFRVWAKIKYAKMSGGQPGTPSYYYLPNVPYIQYFNRDYGLHGAYWHNNFGTPMSHGCINLSIQDAGKLFYWTSPSLPEGKNIAYSAKETVGTRIVVHD
ncbi:hypothetical protein COU97_02235 [Candidatus Shapirobacteria bacterium CG10_big_fil_rev_8_21_14_0_10_48_15]|uniref:L,D-TPase catalytic domain-containing protein n=1 Tax=Candidatus Shapirobacteria bacterium CG10_big_fil_rev_8_21_14_0_10_48_15 TaxID=1974484 RepID=A0A2M8L6Y3_9BACT|nr:MAG: hypothetical protein COU97_02235 [Candidatus Shapirobacteria bacterium CG10_big_fil_rev_8_21_14_0_10_48_15]